ncbi:HAMP domain-containing sensor histidine kinase [Thermoflexus hugenholtzii]
MKRRVPMWRAQYLAIALLGAITVYLNLFISLPREIAGMLARQEALHREAFAGLLGAYLQARARDGVPLEQALREVGPWLSGYAFYAFPPEAPELPVGISFLGITLPDGRRLAVGSNPTGCVGCADPGFWLRLFGLSATIWLALAAVHVWLWIRFSTWLKRIRTAAQAIVAGEAHPPLPPASPDELGQIAEALGQIAASMARFREARRRFLMAAAHELLNPLALLIRELEDLRALELRGEAADRTRRALDQGRHLQRLIEDLLIAAREDQMAFPMRRESLDLADLLVSVVEAYAPRMEAGGRLVNLWLQAAPLPICGDPTRLRQILGNLLENALRYSRPGETIRVIAGRGERVVVEICGGASGAASAGMGLGWSLVEELVRGHGGSVEFLEGSEGVLHVRLVFPLDPSAGVPPPA